MKTVNALKWGDGRRHPFLDFSRTDKHQALGVSWHGSSAINLCHQTPKLSIKRICTHTHIKKILSELEKAVGPFN